MSTCGLCGSDYGRNGNICNRCVTCDERLDRDIGDWWKNFRVCTECLDAHSHDRRSTCPVHALPVEEKCWGVWASRQHLGQADVWCIDSTMRECNRGTKAEAEESCAGFRKRHPEATYEVRPYTEAPAEKAKTYDDVIRASAGVDPAKFPEAPVTGYARIKSFTINGREYANSSVRAEGAPPPFEVRTAAQQVRFIRALFLAAHESELEERAAEWSQTRGVRDAEARASVAAIMWRLASPAEREKYEQQAKAVVQLWNVGA